MKNTVKLFEADNSKAKKKRNNNRFDSKLIEAGNSGHQRDRGSTSTKQKTGIAAKLIEAGQPSSSLDEERTDRNRHSSSGRVKKRASVSRQHATIPLRSSI